MWADQKENEGVDLDKRNIIDKARLFYKAVCRRDGVVLGGFKASTGWLYRFLKRKKIRNIRCTGESCSADDVVAKDFPDVLRGIIEEGEYHPDAIYNMDEAGLQYKLMPKSTFIAKKSKQARGRKIDKTLITLCLCVNQSVTHKMKPLVIRTAQHPRCYKHLSDMKKAPVYWRSSERAWMNSNIMKDWLLNCFVPDVKRKCRQDGCEFKVLLIMDNCPAHAHYLSDSHPNVQVFFLPPQTTSIIQPLDQEIITTVKCRYHSEVFRELRCSTESLVEVRQILLGNENSDLDDDVDVDLPDLMDDPDFPTEDPQLVTVHQFWRRFTVKDVTDHMLRAWESISTATVRHGWKHLTPHLCGDEDSEVQRAAHSISDAVTAAQAIPGCSEVTEEELLEVQAAGEEITAEDIMDSATLEDRLQEEGEVVVEEVNKEPSNAALSSILSAADSLPEALVTAEVCAMRKSEMVVGLEKLLSFYKELYAKRLHEKKQSLIIYFLRPRVESDAESEPEPEPEAAPIDDGSDLDSLFNDSQAGEDFEGFIREVDALETESALSDDGADAQ